MPAAAGVKLTEPRASRYAAAMYADEIRLADPSLGDARLLSLVEHASLADSPYAPEQLAVILGRPEHRAYLAIRGSVAIGFCSCFGTFSDGCLTLEIDMLGVLADHRRQGVAASLLGHAIREASQLGAAAVRAIVADGNSSSLAAFRRVGLSSDAPPRLLFTCRTRDVAPSGYLPPAWREEMLAHANEETGEDGLARAAVRPVAWRIWDAAGGLAAEAQAMPVQTVSYRGLWIERMRGTSTASLTVAARAMVHFAKRAHMDQAGYLLPAEESDTLREVLAGEGFAAASRYHVLGLCPL